MEDLKKKVEALLFSSGRKISLAELSKLCRRSSEDIKSALDELKNEYEEKKSSLMVVNEGDSWKLTTKEEYLHLVKNIVTKTELTKTLMETLAVIAFKYPAKQSDLIKIRTNKAYDHLKELEEMGYITRQKYGRTKLIKLTQKFFDYFSLPKDKLKEQFKDFEGLAKAIESKEEEIKKIKEEQKKKAKEAGKEINLVDEKGNKVELELIDESPPEEKEEKEKPNVDVYEDRLGDLKVIDEPEIRPKKEIKEETKKEEPRGIELTGEMEERVDQRVDEILGLKGIKEKESREKSEEESAKEPESKWVLKEQPTEETTGGTITEEKKIKKVGEEPEEEAESRKIEEQPHEGLMQENLDEEREEEKTEEISEVDKKIDELLHPKEEKAQRLTDIDESKWGKEKKKKDLLSNEEEPKDLLEAAFEEENNKREDE